MDEEVAPDFDDLTKGISITTAAGNGDQAGDSAGPGQTSRTA